jgi:cupin 2 domain-containing protein
MNHGSLTAALPPALADELVTTLVHAPSVRIERIVSWGHRSPPGFWYDQDQPEFVLVVDGEARLELEGEGERHLGPGDWVAIAAHARHRVTWTAPGRPTVWLAVFYGA